MDFEYKKSYDIGDLLKIVKLLRDPEEGCPWDKEQTHSSIKMNFIEETYEVVDAINQANSKMLCEELGDVLLQIALHTQMEKEADVFSFEDVCDGICKKLIYRHPHIFGDVKAEDAKTFLKNWDELKKQEKQTLTAKDNIMAVPASLPALMRSRKVQKRAGQYGISYNNIDEAFADLESEIAELKQAIKDGTNTAEELGDVLFCACNVSRFIDTDAEEALSNSCEKFIDRVCKCEEQAQQNGKPLNEVTRQELDTYWKQAKQLSAGQCKSTAL